MIVKILHKKNLIFLKIKIKIKIKIRLLKVNKVFKYLLIKKLF
jgi:hypothetical protein